MGLGDVLRQARLQKGLDLQTISTVIKVKPEVLAAIESGVVEHIPSVYLKGYIRNYARHLGVPTDVVEQHLATTRGAEPTVQSVFNERPPRSSGDRWIKTSSYVLASAVVIALVWQFTTEAVRFSQGDPVLRSATSAPNSPKSSATNTTGTLATSNPELALIQVPRKSHLRASIAYMNPKSEAGESSGPAIAEGAWAAIGNRDLATSLPLETGTPQGNLEVLTSADSWVEIVDDNGARVEWDLLRAGSHRNYNGKGPFHLLLGRASSVEVFHNGVQVDLGPYTRGNVARLTIGGTEETAPDADVPVTGETVGEQAVTDETSGVEPLPEQG